MEIAAESVAELDAPAEAEEAAEPREVIVQFRDASAHDVRIAGDFNGWVPDKGVRSLTERESEGRVWTKILQLPPGTYQYRYVVDGEWREDPENPRGIPGRVGGRISLLVVS